VSAHKNDADIKPFLNENNMKIIAKDYAF